jgi:4-amino-4-deoxy-L-arabinose transferase-like glycosyltransferase
MIKSFTLQVVNLSVTRLTWLAIVVCIPAFLLNLDTIAFIGDEAIRTLVALEMKLSGNFIVPTLNGEGYYNKPPLYNWFIYLVSGVFGYFGEWPTRVTTLIFLGTFAWTVYYFVSKQFDKLTALTMALMLLTSGRILLWDSMLGLIDICFSWIVYLNFMILYQLAKAERWKLLFILSYLLFSIAFLLKGLPAVVFQSISVITALQLHGTLKKKFLSKDHFTGIGIGIIPLLVYYTVYATRVPLDKVFSILLDQSMQRTATHHGIWKTVMHFFTFPLEQSYHFLPWSLLLLVGFHPKFKIWMRTNDFIRFNFWMLVANVPVYWLSVQVYPRYLLMFVPLFNMVGYYVLQQSKDTNESIWKIFRYVFLAFTLLAALFIIGMPLSAQVRTLPDIRFFWIAGTLLITLCFLCLLVDGSRIFYWFAVAMLIIRLVIFDVVVLPLRKIDHNVNICREDCRRVAEKYQHGRWYLYGKTFPHEVARFYTSGFTNQIIYKVDTVIDSSGYYLVDRTLYPDFSGTMIDSLRLESGQVLALMRAKL